MSLIIVFAFLSQPESLVFISGSIISNLLANLFFFFLSRIALFLSDKADLKNYLFYLEVNYIFFFFFALH